MHKKKLLFSGLIVIILLVLSVLAIPEFIAPANISPLDAEILFGFRLPKSLTALLAGSSLATSGFMLQQLFRNHLAGPYILGVSSGASLAVGLSIIGSSLFPALGGSLGISMAGFTGSMLVLLLVMAVYQRYGTGAIILLFGVILGQISGAVQSMLSYLAVPGDLKHFALWTMGSFSRVSGSDLWLLAGAVTAGLLWSYRLMSPLSVMLLGNDVAGTLGVNTRSTGFQILICTGLLSGIATAFCGPVAFIGMAIPNACRLMFKTADFRFLLLANALLGAGMALLSDVMSSLNIAGVNIPVNVCTALIGGPFILYILLKKKT